MSGSKYVFYKGERLLLIIFYGKPCLKATKPEHINIPKMQFVGGYPDEWCISLNELTEAEKAEITSANGKAIDINREIEKLKAEQNFK